MTDIDDINTRDYWQIDSEILNHGLG